MPLSNDEPRYNSVAVHEDGSSSTIDTRIGNILNGSHNDYLIPPTTNGQSHHSSNTDMATQIDPPEGFEPVAITSEPQPVPGPSKSVSNRASSSSVSSRNSSSSSSDSRDAFAGLQAQNAKNPLQRDTLASNLQSVSHPTHPVEQEVSNSNQQSVPSSTERSNNPKELQATTSSSYPRIMNGFNNMLSKIGKAFANTSLSMISTDRCLQDDTPKFLFGHKRSLERTWKLMDKVVKCCQSPRMNLNNSPPFILEIVPETYQHLKLIHTKYDSSHKYPVNDSEYSQVFLQNLQARCKQTLKLFKDAKDEMFNEESDFRHKLTRHTLVFNHILSELKAIFPGGKFIGDKYLITKKESAGEFWRSNFGSSVLIDWRSFYHALQQVHSIDSSFFSLHALKQTIDLTCDDYISIFEFDVFTRLFQPWSTLLRNWQILAVTHPGYKAFLTYDELKARLQKHIDKPGSYVFRLSCTRLGQWAIGYVTHDRQILQTIVQNISLSQALTDTKFYLYPDGKDEDPNLNVLCFEMAGDERNVTVTEEQYEIYCGVGNSFQTCKICFENDKDIRVEPCNHLLCTYCLIKWQESEGQGCPYCRTEIKETVQITMDLPKSRGQ